MKAHHVLLGVGVAGAVYLVGRAVLPAPTTGSRVGDAVGKIIDGGIGLKDIIAKHIKDVDGGDNTPESPAAALAKTDGDAATADAEGFGHSATEASNEITTHAQRVLST